MKVLVVNSGSSSMKYRLFEVEERRVLAQGICERVGCEDAFMKHRIADNDEVIHEHIPNHATAMKLVFDRLLNGSHAAISSLEEIDAIGHRIVQGGKYFGESALIDDEVIDKISKLSELAPLHNPAAIEAISVCKESLPSTPMVAVFDTSYFLNIPAKAYMYPLPYEMYKDHDVRKYGAHGTSHRYVAERAAAFLGKDLHNLKLVTCHLGNGSSMSAINHGKAVDTSMGFTPLDGLMMGTRSGAIDPAIVPYVMKHGNYSFEEIDELLNLKSGLLGISGISNDLRKVKEASEAGDERAQLAYDMYSDRVKKYIGSYLAIMGGIDAIVVTAGIGENCEKMRRMIFQGLEPLGVVIDHERNKIGSGERLISADESRVKVVVIPTDEEYMIARDTFDIVSKL